MSRPRQAIVPVIASIVARSVLRSRSKSIHPVIPHMLHVPPGRRAASSPCRRAPRGHLLIAACSDGRGGAAGPPAPTVSPSRDGGLINPRGRFLLGRLARGVTC